MNVRERWERLKPPRFQSFLDSACVTELVLTALGNEAPDRMPPSCNWVLPSKKQCMGHKLWPAVAIRRWFSSINLTANSRDELDSLSPGTSSISIAICCSVILFIFAIQYCAATGCRIAASENASAGPIGLLSPGDRK